jgi:hypothetical protein
MEQSEQRSTHPINPETVEALGESSIRQLLAGKDNLPSMMVTTVGIVIDVANAGFGFRLLWPVAVVLDLA